MFAETDPTANEIIVASRLREETVAWDGFRSFDDSSDTREGVVLEQF